MSPCREFRGSPPPCSDILSARAGRHTSDHKPENNLPRCQRRESGCQLAAGHRHRHRHRHRHWQPSPSHKQIENAPETPQSNPSLGRGITLIYSSFSIHGPYLSCCHRTAGLEKWFQRWRGLGLGGPRGKGSQVYQRAQNYLYNYCSCCKQSKIRKKGPFSLYIGSPGPTQEMELMGPGGEGPSRSTPVSPAMSYRLNKATHTNTRCTLSRGPQAPGSSVTRNGLGRLFRKTAWSCGTA